ncbi:putative histone deacetylase complex subunit cti6 like protein [Verticillium longisporum]|uniref:Putative histone deacetylase complex subunit cti6 like protein n=1 Tax=Verticillium longisporum TaxID=100787 RepID=A0A8I2ZD95_VERLO|nr:putative histone deacetylase complex subunit cti6 like protein [Verticillium longisporum]
MANDGDDIQEDDESVRCICGFDEYPGPPPFDDDVKSGKENPEADFFASIELSDEVSGQCDICKVWQHGACVGIFTEESSPDEYFCEKCRKDLHKIHIASNRTVAILHLTATPATTKMSNCDVRLKQAKRKHLTGNPPILCPEDSSAGAATAKKREGHSTAESEPAEDTAAVLAPARPVVKPNVEPPPPPPVEPTPSAAPTPDPTPAPPAPTGSTHKKSSRSHQKRAKGRNQYTKDRDDPEASPVRSMSRDTVRQEEAAIGGGTTKVSGVDSGRHTARSKAHLHSKASLPDMKRRVAAFLDFISKTQIEMAGESSSGSGSSQNNSEQHSPRDAVPGATETHANGVSTTESKVAHHANGDSAAPAGGQDFKELSCVEMMDVLTRDLVKWQNQYAN